MALRKKRRREGHREHYTGSLEERDTARLSEMLAPPEERAQKKKATKEGAIVVDASKLKVAEEFAQADDAGPRILGFEPVVLVIVVLVIAFICFIAYLISFMPPKP
ncbi:MAG TPA: hypothetical protein VF754_00725 [Pyrinomonadaceae bacterium]